MQSSNYIIPDVKVFVPIYLSYARNGINWDMKALNICLQMIYHISNSERICNFFDILITNLHSMYHQSDLVTIYRCIFATHKVLCLYPSTSPANYGSIKDDAYLINHDQSSRYPITSNRINLKEWMTVIHLPWCSYDVVQPMGPFYQDRLPWIKAWISDHMPSYVRGEITCIMDVITYAY